MIIYQGNKPNTNSHYPITSLICIIPIYMTCSWYTLGGKLLVSKSAIMQFVFMCSIDTWRLWTLSFTTKNLIFKLSFVISSIYSFESTLSTSKSTQILVQVHWFFLIIHIICPSQFYFSFVTQCFKNHFEISPKLHKNH